MQTKFSHSTVGVLVGLFVATIASAHPGHAPTNLAAQISQPFAGADHLAAFVALTVALLLGLRVALKVRNGKTKMSGE